MGAAGTGGNGIQEDMDGSWYNGKQPGLGGSVLYRETLGLTGRHGVTGIGLVPRGLGVRKTMGTPGAGTRGSLAPGQKSGLVDTGGMAELSRSGDSGSFLAPVEFRVCPVPGSHGHRGPVPGRLDPTGLPRTGRTRDSGTPGLHGR